MAPVLIAVLGVLGTLGGVALGAGWGCGTSSADGCGISSWRPTWPSNHAAHTFDLAWGRQTEAKDAHELTATYAALNEHQDRLLLLAPPAVQRATQEVVKAATRAVGAFGQRARVADGERAIRQFTDLFAELRHAQRAELQQRDADGGAFGEGPDRALGQMPLLVGRAWDLVRRAGVRPGMAVPPAPPSG